MVERVLRFDDLDNVQGAETHTLSLDGPPMEVDLTPANYDRLKQAMEPFLLAGHKVPKATKNGKPRFTRPSQPTRPPTAGNGHGNGGEPSDATVRAWAKQNGLTVNDRGKLAQSLRDAYAARDTTVAGAPETAPTITKERRSKVKQPPHQDTRDLLRQVGTFKALAAALGVSTPTATRWAKEASDALDPLS